MNHTSHNIDQYMSDLRQILAQGKKRIGILLGAGAPYSINVSENTDEHTPLIPAVDGLTETVKTLLNEDEQALMAVVIESLDGSPNIEDILSRVRSVSSALRGTEEKLGEFSQADYDGLAKSICKHIGKLVNRNLPSNTTPFNRLAGWIGGTDRDHPIEIFTSNYDLLMEEALEHAKIPFFSGFSGCDEPFFDAASISGNDDLPARWARVWKLHGSLGWRLNANKELIAGQGRDANELIYPDHLKYDHIQKFPYTALFDRLRKFLMTPDTLLLTCGFSFADSHISAVVNEALAANPSASVFAFLYGKCEDQKFAEKLALSRPNFSVYACDRAVINCVDGVWELGRNKDNKDWQQIQASFWASRKADEPAVFLLGDFVSFANFFALSKSDQGYSSSTAQTKGEAEQ